MAEIMDVDTEPAKPAQTPAPVTEPTGWMSPTGEIRDGAPEAVANLLGAKKWTTVEQVVDGFTNLEKMLGAGEHLFVPESAEDTGGWDKVFSALGRPETHDKYEFASESEIPLSDELVGQFKQFAHGLGLSQKQFSDVVNFQLDAVKAQGEAYATQTETQKQANIDALQLKWGNAYDAKIKGARIIADSLGIYQTLEDKGLASDPVIIDMLDVIASRTSEDVIAPQAPSAPAKTPQEELNDIMKSESFLQKFHRDHKATMTRYMQLNQEIANAGQARQPQR